MERIGSDDETSADKVPFIHQSQWQRRMLQLYGQHTCLIDSTYKTSAYDMPLFAVCVPTNVGYSYVTTTLLLDETIESYSVALTSIREHNPDWDPKCFITDFHDAQIAAIGAVFPSKCAFFYIADICHCLLHANFIHSLY
jgi:hypothetical protein